MLSRVSFPEGIIAFYAKLATCVQKWVTGIGILWCSVSSLIHSLQVSNLTVEFEKGKGLSLAFKVLFHVPLQFCNLIYLKLAWNFQQMTIQMLCGWQPSPRPPIVTPLGCHSKNETRWFQNNAEVRWETHNSSSSYWWPQDYFSSRLTLIIHFLATGETYRWSISELSISCIVRFQETHFVTLQFPVMSSYMWDGTAVFIGQTKWVQYLMHQECMELIVKSHKPDLLKMLQNAIAVSFRCDGNVDRTVLGKIYIAF